MWLYDTKSILLIQCGINSSTLILSSVCASLCLSPFLKPRWTTAGDKGNDRQRWLTDFLFPEDTSTAKRWFLLDDVRLWIHKQWSQLYALLTGDGGKTSEAVSGSAAIKPTQGLCFPLLLAYQSLGSTVCLIKQMKYFSNIMTTWKTH